MRLTIHGYQEEVEQDGNSKQGGPDNGFGKRNRQADRQTNGGTGANVVINDIVAGKRRKNSGRI